MNRTEALFKVLKPLLSWKAKQFEHIQVINVQTCCRIPQLLVDFRHVGCIFAKFHSIGGLDVLGLRWACLSTVLSATLYRLQALMSAVFPATLYHCQTLFIPNMDTKILYSRKE